MTFWNRYIRWCGGHGRWRCFWGWNIFQRQEPFLSAEGFSYWWRQTVGSLGKEGRRPAEGARRRKGNQPVPVRLHRVSGHGGNGKYRGVATALTAGGPGALFWMWVSAFIGMITAYVETMLGLRYRYRGEDGHYMCGPLRVHGAGLGIKWLGVLYGLLCLMSSLGMGSMVQSNSAVGTMAFSWHIPPLIGGAALTLSSGW